MLAAVHQTFKGVTAVQLDMSADDVINRIRELGQQGESLNKKRVKKSEPELMKHALYYYPSWEHAIRETGLELQQDGVQ